MHNGTRAQLSSGELHGKMKHVFLNKELLTKQQAPNSWKALARKKL